MKTVERLARELMSNTATGPWKWEDTWTRRQSKPPGGLFTFHMYLNGREDMPKLFARVTQTIGKGPWSPMRWEVRLAGDLTDIDRTYMSRHEELETALRRARRELKLFDARERLGWMPYEPVEREGG